MTPPRRRRSPPHLVDDAVEEVLLRLPPDESASLFRAAAVCRTWRRLLTTDAAFSARYRAFHGTPPILGFFRRWIVGSKRGLFIPTTSFRPSAADDDHLQHFGAQREIPNVPSLISFSMKKKSSYAVALRRAATGRGSIPFIVASAGVSAGRTTANARLYSSETGAWSDVISIKLDSMEHDLGHYNRSFIFTDETHGNPVVDDAVCFIGEFGNVILRYDLVGRRLSVIQLPEVASIYYDVILMPARGGWWWAWIRNL
ncbi:hypothetical protein QOZ80_7BG0585290 [Eleusine coracana subsp. coracana]|nr:hypothetical protein QOZ80_7BG0585290 [Eleusine coracana subsp. coracana]